MKSLLYIGLAVVVLAAAGFGGYSIYKHYNAKENEVPKVYFTRDISPAGLMRVYKATGWTPHAGSRRTNRPGQPHIRTGRFG